MNYPSSLILLLLSLLVLCAYSADPCAFSATARPRTSSDGSWTANGKQYQIYDILVTNTGTCELTRVSAFFAYPNTIASIENPFNYDSSSGEVTGFGASLAPGATFSGAGFILVGSGVPTLARARPFCPSSCTSRPTIAPSDAPLDSCNNECKENQVCVAVESNVPTCHFRLCSDLNCSAPGHVCLNNGGVARCLNLGATPAPSSAPQSPCQSLSSVSVSVAKRAGSDFQRDGVNNAIYDLTFSATAAVKVDLLKVSVVPASGFVLLESWNLREISGSADQYFVDTYGALDKAGAVYNSAGFVLTGDKLPSVSLLNFTCSA